MMTRIRIIATTTAAVLAITTLLTAPALADPVGGTGNATGGTATAGSSAPTTQDAPTLTSAPHATAAPTPTADTPTSSRSSSEHSTSSTDTPTPTTENWSEVPSEAASESSASAASGTPTPVQKKPAIVVPTVPLTTLALTIGIATPLVGPAIISPGSTWTGTGSVSVIGTQGLAVGWTATARLSPLTGRLGSVLTPTSATYTANGAGCSGSAVSTTVPLTNSAATIRSASPLCIIAGWNMSVAITVPPAGVLADTYSATLTQSIA